MANTCQIVRDAAQQKFYICVVDESGQEVPEAGKIELDLAQCYGNGVGVREVKNGSKYLLMVCSEEYTEAQTASQIVLAGGTSLETFRVKYAPGSPNGSGGYYPETIITAIAIRIAPDGSETSNPALVQIALPWALRTKPYPTAVITPPFRGDPYGDTIFAIKTPSGYAGVDYVYVNTDGRTWGDTFVVCSDGVPMNRVIPATAPSL